MSIRTQTISLTRFNKEPLIVVEFSYDYDDGVHTYSNGDPGYPPSEDLEILSVTDEFGNDMSELFDRIDSIFGHLPKYKSVWDSVADSIDLSEDDW